MVFPVNQRRCKNVAGSRCSVAHFLISRPTFHKHAVADIKVKTAEYAVSALYLSLARVIGAQKKWFRFKIRHLQELTGKCQMKAT